MRRNRDDDAYASSLLQYNEYEEAETKEVEEAATNRCCSCKVSQEDGI